MIYPLHHCQNNENSNYASQHFVLVRRVISHIILREWYQKTGHGLWYAPHGEWHLLDSLFFDEPFSQSHLYLQRHDKQRTYPPLLPKELEPYKYWTWPYLFGYAVPLSVGPFLMHGCHDYLGIRQ